MSHKRKGMLTTWKELHKHMDKISKRFFWKTERLAEKEMINKKISDLSSEKNRK